METIFIEIFDKRQAEMGIEVKDKLYTPLYFNPQQLVGYWISTDDDGTPEEITLYIGGHVFVAKADEENIYKLNQILNPK